jgi:hypothetical protein
VRWLNSSEEAATLLTFVEVVDGTATYADQIAAAEEKINALPEATVDFTQMFRVYNTKSNESTAMAWTPNADASRGALTAYDENDYKQIWQFVEGTGDKAGKYLIYNVLAKKYMQAVGGSNGVALTSNVNQAVYYTAEKHATENKYAFYHDPAATNWLYNDGGGKLAGWKNNEGDHYFTLEVVDAPVVELKDIDPSSYYVYYTDDFKKCQASFSVRAYFSYYFYALSKNPTERNLTQNLFNAII